MTIPIGQAELPQPGPARADDAGDAWLAAMAVGDFPAAWQVSDRVLAARPPAQRDDSALPYHLRWVWDGTPVDGRDVLVRCYHGLGDTLQFCRFLPALRARAARVTLEVQAALAALLAAEGSVDQVVAFDPAAPLTPRACTLEIMELCHALRMVPERDPYLVAPKAVARGGIGVCWRVGVGWRPERSIPLADLGAALPPDAALQSLQPDEPAGMAPCPAELLDTARVIAGLAAVVTVDTMVAHLAGALGTPVHLLLPAEPDWRWRAGGRGSVWYRGIRKYRQRRAGDWSAPLAALAADLTGPAQPGTVEE